MNEVKNGKKIIKLVLGTILVVALSLLLLKSCTNKTDVNDDKIDDSNKTSDVVDDSSSKQEETVIDDKKEDETVIVEEDTKQEEAKEDDEADVTTLSYWVNFLNIDGSVLQRSLYKYGSTPAYKGETPTYYDASYTYTFTGWDKKFTSVTMTQTYTAVYSKTKNESKPQVVNPLPKENLKYDGTVQELITAGTGATFTYSLNGGTYSATIPTATNAGSYEIKYKKDGVDAGVILVTIAQRDITIETASAEKVYDGILLTASEAADVWISAGSLADGDTYSVTMDTSITSAGSVTNELKDVIFFDEDQDDISDNYNVTKVEGTLTVTKRPITITSNSNSKIYDGTPLTTSNPSITSGSLSSGDNLISTVTGIQNGVGSSDNTFTYTIKNVDEGEDVTNNYDVTCNYGTLTVTKATITVTPDSNQSKIYDGTTATNITYTYSGNIVGETPAFNGALGLKDNAVNAGTYDIVKNTLVAKDNGSFKVTNYEIKFVETPVTYTINKATATIDIANVVKTYTYNGSEQTVNSGATVDSNGTITYTNNTFTDVPTSGKQTVTISAAETTNYNAASTTVEITINKATASIDTTNVVKTYTYNGNEQTVNSGAILNHSETTLSYTNNTFTNVPESGKQTVTISAAETTNYKATSTTVEITINKATPTVTAPTAKTLTYNDAEQELVNAGSTTGGTLNYKLGSGEYGTSIPKAKDANTYTVYYKVVGDSNYNDVAEASINVTIKKADVTGSVSAINTLTYNGIPQDLVASTITGGTVYYYDGQNWTTTIPQETNAGTYSVKYKVTGDKNHNDIAETTISNITIAKAASSISSAPTANTLTYTGEAQALVTAGSATGGDLQYKLDDGEYSASIPTATNADTYTVYYKVVGDSNHNDLTSDSYKINVTISQKKAVVTAPTAKTLTYAGEAQELITAGSVTGGTLQYKLDSGEYSTSIPTATNAGTYTVYYKAVKDNSGNYADSDESSIQVTIKKATPTITAPTAKTLTYNDAEQELVNAGSTTGGTLNYKFGSGEYGTSIPKAKDANTYTVYYKVVGDSNYNDVAEQSISVTINKLGVNEPAVSGTYTYTGSEQTVTLTGVETYMSTSSSLKQTNAGSYDLVYTLDNNHKWNEGSDGTITWTINRKDATINITSVVKTYTYTGSLQTVNSGATVDSNGTITYTNNTFTNVPESGKQTITISAAETTNYKAASTTVEITINKATTAITNLSLTDWTYGATANTPTADTNFGAIVYTYSDSESGTYSSTVPTDAGTYYVKASVEGTSNYTSAEAKKSFTINKAKIDVPKANTGLTYSGNEQTGVTLPSEAKYTLSNNTATDAGSYTATATLKNKNNYEWDLTTPTSDNQTISWSISQKFIAVTAKDQSSYVGSDLVSLTYDSEKLCGNNVFVGELATTANKNAVGTYDITQGTLSAGANYNIVYTKGTYTVKALETQTLTFTESAITKSYGDAKFTQSVTGAKTTVTYSSSDTSVATVDSSTGEITIQKVGTTTIKASAAETAVYASSEATYTLTINKAKVTVPTANANLSYNGQTQTGVTLPENAVYSLTDNTATAVGDYTATATLSDKTNYEWNLDTPTSDDQSIAWSIAKKQLTISGTTVADKTYDGTTTATVTAGTLSGIVGAEVVKVSIASANFEDANAGSDKSVTISYAISGTNADNYLAPIDETINANITAKQLSDASITVNSIDTQVYTGSAITPEPTVKDGNTTLTKDTDYNVSYYNNTAAGTATITITGKGNYTDTKDTTFIITAVTLNKSLLEIAKDIATELTATVYTTDKTVTWSSSDENVATVDSTGKVTAVGFGTATITVTATNGTATTDDDSIATCTVNVGNYLTFTAVTVDSSVTIAFKNTDWSYSTDGGITWEDNKIKFSNGNSAYDYYYEKITLTNVGDNVIVKGTNCVTCTTNTCNFSMSGKIAASGSVTSITDGMGINSSVSLSDNCYNSMFYNCKALTTAPELPATTLKFQCYREMFRDCTSLTIAPELPATILAKYCYWEMFKGCSSLKVSNGVPTGATSYGKICKYTKRSTSFDAYDMFGSTGGTFTGTISKNNTYYWYTGQLDQSITAPTATSENIKATAVTLTAISDGIGDTQYGCSTTNDSTFVTNWTTSTTFTDLTPNTNYYFFARYAGNSNYKTTTSTSTEITTKEATIVTVPTAITGLVYDGTEKTGVVLPADAKYTLTNNTATNAGSYTATATLNDPSMYVWDLNPLTSEDQSIPWSIAKADQSDDDNLYLEVERDDPSIATVSIVGDYVGTVQYGCVMEGTSQTDPSEWQSSNVFSDLDSSSNYTFYAKIIDENYEDLILLKGASCFIAGTKISMADGTTKNIEDIVIGDEVMSYDVVNSEFYTTTVNKVWASTNTTISTITLADGTQIQCTPNHPICTTDGFKSVNPNFTGGLKEYPSTTMDIGDMVVTDHGIFAVASIETNKVEVVPVYNLSVISNGNELNNTFIANGVVAHNKGD